MAPFGWSDFLFQAAPWKIRGFDHFVLLALLLAGAERRGPRVPEMRNALLLAAATTTFFFVYGIATGGGAYEASWQTYLMMSGLLFAVTAASVFRTPEHFAMLAKTILAAGAFRALMCVLFWLIYVRTNSVGPLELYTSHDDTVLWCVCVFILLDSIIESRAMTSSLRDILLMLLIVLGIVLNNRRIAWVSLAMASVVWFALLPAGRVKRRIARSVLALAPVLLLYVTIGWGRSGRLFKPLQSFATVTTQEDESTKARNCENLGLIATSNASSMLFGTGWGHPYIEVSNKYSIAFAFPLWQYVPHNSILGLLAYTGVLGFSGYWMSFPTAMFLNSRMARLSKAPLARKAGRLAGCSMVICANQFYGDQGIFYVKSIYFLSLAYAVALRLPLSAGVWPGRAAAYGRHSTRPAPATATELAG
jgi:hypothetical protein